MEYISNQIKLIENSAKLRLGGIKEDLDKDNEKILNQILSEYEKYTEENSKKQEDKSEHQKFVDQYIVSPEDLPPILDIDRENGKVKEKVNGKVYEDLPGNVLE